MSTHPLTLTASPKTVASAYVRGISFITVWLMVVIATAMVSGRVVLERVSEFAIADCPETGLRDALPRADLTCAGGQCSRLVARDVSTLDCFFSPRPPPAVESLHRLRCPVHSARYSEGVGTTDQTPLFLDWRTASGALAAAALLLLWRGGPAPGFSLSAGAASCAGAVVLALLAAMMLSRLPDPEIGIPITISSLLAVVLLWPLAEEIVFRRLALHRFLVIGQPLVGIVLVSLLFAGMHSVFAESVYRPVQFASLLSLSLLCSYAYMRSGLGAAFATHASYNATLAALALVG